MAPGGCPARRTMTEAEFTDAVVEYAHLRGWVCAHFRPARTAKGWATPVSFDGQGYPDLTMARAGVVVLAELKVGRNRLTEAQERWVAASGAYVWHPDSWPEIEQVLA